MSTGRVYKRGRKWWIQYSVEGRQYRESAKTSRREQAETLLRERQREIWEGRFFPGARARAHKTVGQLRDMWLKEKAGKSSIGSDRIRFAKFCDHVGEHRQLVAISTDVIVGFLDTLKDHEPSTRNRYRALLRAALKLATRRDIAHRDPMRGIDMEAESNARNRICSPAEYAKLRDGAKGDLRALIVVGYWLGMREAEIANLTRDRVDTDAGTIRLGAGDTKEKAAKTLPIPTEAAEELRKLPARLNGRIFAFSANTYSRQFTALCGELGIADLHFHDLRHTALTRMGEAGVDIFVMQALSGHKTLAMLKRYVHTNPARLRAAMDTIEAHASRIDASKR
jgi:integrase